jgi:hypothetical protein
MSPRHTQFARRTKGIYPYEQPTLLAIIQVTREQDALLVDGGLYQRLNLEVNSPSGRPVPMVSVIVVSPTDENEIHFGRLSSNHLKRLLTASVGHMLTHNSSDRLSQLPARLTPEWSSEIEEQRYFGGRHTLLSRRFLSRGHDSVLS